MRRRARLRILIFALALVVILGGWGAMSAAEASRYRAMERHIHYAAMSDLSQSLAELSDTLTKSRYAGSPELLAAVSTEITNHSETAIAALATLPLADVSLERTETFITRAGDYAAYLTRCAAAHTEPSDAERDSLAALAATAAQLSHDVLTLEDDVYGGSVDFRKEYGETISGAAERFSVMEEALPADSTVHYDGAMSAHILQRTPQLTADCNDVDAETATKLAAMALGIPAARLTLIGETDGEIPRYEFRADTGDHAEISRAGGYIVAMRRVRAASDTDVTNRDVLAAARAYLRQLGYSGMQQIWQHTDGDETLYRFAWQGDGVLVYPDLITVGVSRSDGTVTSLNAANYIMHHHPRDFAEPAVTPEQAAEAIDDTLSVRCLGRAVIHSPGAQEIECYEFLCTTPEGEEMLLYCDTQDGTQRELLLLHKDADGMDVQ